MPILKSVTGNTWPLSGAATAGTTGLHAISGTGLVHIASSDLPPGSLSTGYVTGNPDTTIAVTLDDPATIFAASDVYTYSLWVRHRVTGTRPTDPANRRILDLSGEGIRVMLALYFRPVGLIDEGGLCPLMSRITGTGTMRVMNTAPAGPVVAGYDDWVRYDVEVDGTAGNGAFRWYIDGNLIAEWTGANNTGKAGLTGAATLTFGYTGLQVDICGPVVSYNGTSDPILPTDRVVKPGDLTTQCYPMRFADSPRGAHWKVLGSPAFPPTVTAYPIGGNSPYRTRLIVASDVTIETTKPLGDLPYNELGWATLVFPMMYAANTGSISIKLRNPANDDNLVTFVAGTTHFTLNGQQIAPRDPAVRYAMLLHIHQAGAVHATMFDVTSSGGQQRAWSGKLDTTTGPLGPVGPVQITGANDLGLEIDGMYVCRWADLVGIDSLTSSATSGVTPAYYCNNRMARECVPALTDAMQMPNYPPIDPVYTQWGVVPGRPGRSLVSVPFELLNGMEHTRGIRWVQIDGGSINDLSGVTDLTRKSKTDTWKAALSSLVARLTATGNRVYLMTMVRREQGSTYSAVQNRTIDTMNGIIRQVAATQQRASGGIALVQLSDPAWVIDDHAALFAGGDDTHPHDPSGNVIIAQAMRDTITSDTGALGLAASVESIVAAQNADATQAAARAAAATAASEATAAAIAATAASPANMIITFKADTELGTAPGGMVANVGKIPRAATAKADGEAVTRNKVGTATATTLTETLS